MQKTFSPKTGQPDYTNIRWVPVINCVLRYEGKMLLVKRSSDLKLYPDFWNGISGFLDDQQSLEDKVKEEIQEELGMSPDHIQEIRLGTIFHQDAPEYKKTWIVHPLLVDVTTNKVHLDWEAKEFAWVPIQDVQKYNVLPGFDRVLQNFF